MTDKTNGCAACNATRAMEPKVLADNHAPGQSLFFNIIDISSALVLIGGGIYLLSLFPIAPLPSILITLIPCYYGYLDLEEFLISNFGHETISIEHEHLVIKRKGYFLRRSMEIPLSTIRKIIYDEGRNPWYPIGVSFPEHLRVYYGDSRFLSTRFGLNMPIGEQGVLTNRIMKQVNKYK